MLRESLPTPPTKKESLPTNSSSTCLPATDFHSPQEVSALREHSPRSHPEWALNDCLPLPLPPPGDGLAHFHPLLFRCAVGVETEHGEVILSHYCPVTKCGPGECPQGQHSPTAIVAGFPNWNHLSAQVPKALRKKERGKPRRGEDECWAVGQVVLWRELGHGRVGTPLHQSESTQGHSFICL